MPSLPIKVLPGDLVTAEFMNSLLDVCADLQTRLGRLENLPHTNSGPVIDSIDRLVVRVGEQLEVVGRNFPANPADGSVDLGGATVTQYSLVSASRLSFFVPAQTQALPAQAILTIRNGGKQASEVLTVLAAQTAPKGRVVVTNTTGSLGEATPGAVLNLTLSVDSQTNIPERYKISVRFTNLTGTATRNDWTSATTLRQVLDGGATSAVGAETLVNPGRPVQFRAEIRVPDKTGSADFALVAESLSAPSDALLNQGSSPIHLEIGATPVVSDPRTKFTIARLGPAANARLATIDGLAGLEVQNGAREFVSVNATFTERGSYSYTVEFRPDQGDFTAGPVSPAGSDEVAGGQEQIGFDLGVSTDPANLANHREQRTLRITARRGSNAEAVSSWIDIPIRAF